MKWDYKPTFEYHLLLNITLDKVIIVQVVYERVILKKDEAIATKLWRKGWAQSDRKEIS